MKRVNVKVAPPIVFESRNRRLIDAGQGRRLALGQTRSQPCQLQTVALVEGYLFACHLNPPFLISRTWRGSPPQRKTPFHV